MSISGNARLKTLNRLFSGVEAICYLSTNTSKRKEAFVYQRIFLDKMQPKNFFTQKLSQRVSNTMIMRGTRHLICVSGYRDSLCHVANCLGKSASFLRFWIAASFTCCGTRFSARYGAQRKTRCQQIRLLPRAEVIRLLDLPSSQRIRLLYTWTSGSTRIISATDAGREGVWSSQTPISRNWLRQNFGIWLPLEIRFKAEDFVFQLFSQLAALT